MKTRRIRYLFDLISMLTLKEIKTKYKSATLGFLWIFINPLLQMIVLTVVFSLFLKIKIPNYPLFVFSGLLPWTYFSLGVQGATSSLINNRDIIKKVPFPRELLPIAAILAQLIPFIFSLIILSLFVIVTKGFSLTLLFLFPVILLQTVLMINIGLLLSSLDIYYRDVTFLLQAIILVWFYGTPVLYSLSFVPHKYLFYYQLNPLVGITSSYQAILVTSNYFNGIALLFSLAVTISLLPISYWIFKKRANFFADWI